MIEQPNPYEAPNGTSLLRGSILWPRTPERCILLSLFAWPMTMFVTDIVGTYVESATSIEDFGVAAFGFTMPLVCLYSLVLWFRAFMPSKSSKRWVAAFLVALLALPGWLFFTVVVTFINFPFGRIVRDW